MSIFGSPWAVVLVSAALVLGEPATATARTRDLDTYTPAQLDRDLRAELDDIYEGHDPDADVDFQEVHDEVMEALSDANDDESESEIDFADLEEEMSEINTTVEKVVTAALRRADQASVPRRSGEASVGGPSAEEFSDFRLTRSIALREVSRSLTAGVRAARRP